MIKPLLALLIACSPLLTTVPSSSSAEQAWKMRLDRDRGATAKRSTKRIERRNTRRSIRANQREARRALHVKRMQLNENQVAVRKRQLTLDARKQERRNRLAAR